MPVTKSGFSVAWEQYSSVMCAGFQELQQRAEFVDMTIAADGHLVRAHQMVVGLASPFLKEMLRSAPSPHPVLFLNNVSHNVLCCLLEYMYTGEAFVRGELLKDFIAIGKALHVRGLEDTILPSSPSTEEISQIPTSPVSKQSEYQIIPIKSDTLKLKAVVKDRKGIGTSPTQSLSATQPLSKTHCSISSLGSKNMPDVSSLPSDVQNIDTEMGMETLDETAFSDDDQQGDDDSEMYANYELGHKETEAVKSGPADKEMERKKIKIMYAMSNKGGLQLILNRYVYRLCRKYKDGTRRWNCVDCKKKCGAVVVTEDENVVRRFSMHNHPYHDKKILDKVKKNAVFTSLEDSGFN